jgi:hypothetical protein
LKIDAAAETSGALCVEEGQVRLEAANVRRVKKARVADVRLYIASKLVHSNGLELANVEARTEFATHVQTELASVNGTVGVGLDGLRRLLLALDEAVYRDESARRGRRASSALPPIDADDLDLARVSERAWMALQASNEPPYLFRVGGVPSRIEMSSGAPAVVRPLTLDRLRYHMARVVDWRHDRGQQPALPPLHVVRDMLAHPDPPLPRLDRIVGAPVFAADGTLLLTPGYHSAAGVFYESSGLLVPPIPKEPTEDDIRRAVSTLAEPLAEFPFIGDAERAHAYALLLLPFMRAMIAGATPLHLFEKPMPRTSASLLVSVLTLPALGRPVTVMTPARDGDEWRKRITAALLGSPAVIAIDNLRERLDSEHLSAVLTAWPFWKDRPMGLSEMREIPNLPAWTATANNPALSNEMAGRVVRSRLDARTDRPWERTEYRIPRLVEWVTERRAQLIHAALMLIWAWLVRGRPPGRATLSGFEAWSFAVGGVLDVAGIPGFLDNVREVYEMSDVEGAEIRRLLGLWWDRFADSEVGVAEIFPLADEADFPLVGRNERAQRTSLGARLTRLRDRRYVLEGADGTVEVYLQTAGKHHRVARWRLARTSRLGGGTPTCTGTPHAASETTESPAQADGSGDLRVPCPGSDGARDDNPTGPPGPTLASDRWEQGQQLIEGGHD